MQASASEAATCFSAGQAAGKLREEEGKRSDETAEPMYVHQQATTRRAVGFRAGKCAVCAVGLFHCFWDFAVQR